ncbi:hypothetical protein HOY80DRAFT_537433 [Tuber brumale]|nr:hypothetical protein HOY80DRAFT_537433 [Tuber brumale]
MRRGRCSSKMRVLHSLRTRSLYCSFFSLFFLSFFSLPSPSLTYLPLLALATPSSPDNQIEKRDQDVESTQDAQMIVQPSDLCGRIAGLGQRCERPEERMGGRGSAAATAKKGVKLSLVDGTVATTSWLVRASLTAAPVRYSAESALLVPNSTNGCRPLV